MQTTTATTEKTNNETPASPELPAAYAQTIGPMIDGIEAAVGRQVESAKAVRAAHDAFQSAPNQENLSALSQALGAMLMAQATGGMPPSGPLAPLCQAALLDCQGSEAVLRRQRRAAA